MILDFHRLFGTNLVRDIKACFRVITEICSKGFPLEGKQLFRKPYTWSAPSVVLNIIMKDNQ